jgi:hypothetical protein
MLLGLSFSGDGVGLSCTLLSRTLSTLGDMVARLLVWALMEELKFRAFNVFCSDLQEVLLFRKLCGCVVLPSVVLEAVKQMVL